MLILVEVLIDYVVRNDNIFNFEMYIFFVFEKFDW